MPDGFLPEGIAIGPGPIAYFGSRADGDIYAADLRTGQGAVFSQGPGTPSIGLKSDQRGTLYVAGGPAGTGRVVSARTGAILASYPFTTGESFVNDVVLTKRMAWFTDSRQAQLYGIPLARHGVAAPESAIVRLPLKGDDWVQTPGVNNANGIAQTPDRSALLVVKSNTGQLFRVDPRTGKARVVDLGGYALTNGDGLLVEGRTLYVVQNRLNRVAVLELNRSGSRGDWCEYSLIPASTCPPRSHPSAAVCTCRTPGSASPAPKPLSTGSPGSTSADLLHLRTAPQ